MAVLHNSKYFASVVYLTVQLLHLTAATSLSNQCPCEIDVATSTADCFSKGLTKVPKCVSNETRELILAANSFTTLYPKQFERFTNLRNLSLFSNIITLIMNNSFTGLSNLFSLDLQGNELHILNSSTFTGLPNLCILNLDYNKISSLTDYAFYDLPSLINLSLTHNQISYLSKHAFKGLSKLRYLNLETNPLRSVESIPVKVFKPLITLEELHINNICGVSPHCRYIDKTLRHIPSLKRLYMDLLPNQILGDGFNLLKNLEELHFNGYNGVCQLRQISEKTFASLQTTPLTMLELKHCNIHIINGLFTHLRNLTYLDISENSYLCNLGISSITDKLDTTNVKYLNISGFCTRFSSSFTSDGLLDTHLQTLDLSNSAVSIDVESLLYLPKSLKHLFLQRNFFEYVEFGELLHLKNLVSLDLSHQLFRKRQSTAPQFKANHSFGERRATERQSFRDKFSSYITKVNHSARRTTISNFNVQPTNGENNCWSIPFRLQSIDISFSSLVHQMPAVCYPNNSLTILKVSNQEHVYSSQNFANLWKTIPMLRRLEYFDISNNRMKDIPEHLFSYQKYMRHLLINGNSLRVVNFDIRNMTYLESLDLSDNNIQYLSKQFSDNIETIAKNSHLTVFLQNNNLVCSCDRQDFVTWLLKTKVLYQKETLECQFQNGTQLSLSYIADIHERLEAECIAIPVILCCSIGFPVLLLLLSLVAVVYYKRWRFKYLLSVGRRNISPYHPLEDRAIDMDKDVYISYERDFIFAPGKSLHEFVTQVLYPALQNRGFKVLIRDELDSGRRLYDVISKAVRRSKTIVVLLSNDYCIDMWNVYEFNMAVMEGIYTKQEKIVPVMLEILNPEHLQEEVYAFLISEPVPKYTCEVSACHLIDYLTERIVR